MRRQRARQARRRAAREASPSPAPLPSRRRWLAAAAALLVVFAVGTAAFGLMRGSRAHRIDAVNALLSQRRYAEAQQALEALIRESPSAGARVLLAGLLRRQGRETEALGHLQQAVADDPEHAEAHNNLGNLLGELGRLAEALPHLERAVALTEDASGESRVHGLARVNLAMALDRLGRSAEADAAWESALRANAGRPEVALAAANYFGRRGRWAAAATLLAPLANASPRDAALQRDYAHALVRDGRGGEALAPLERLMAMEPGDLDVMFNVASLRFDAGNRDGARALCEAILAASPEHARARQLILFTRDLVIDLE